EATPVPPRDEAAIPYGVDEVVAAPAHADDEARHIDRLEAGAIESKSDGGAAVHAPGEYEVVGEPPNAGDGGVDPERLPRLLAKSNRRIHVDAPRGLAHPYSGRRTPEAGH